MVNNGDVHIEKPSDCLVAQCFSCSACVLTLGVFDLKRCCTDGQCMTSKYRESDKSRLNLCFQTALAVL